MSNESEIASRFAGWMSEHWPWLSGSVLAAVFVVKKLYGFFQGMNRMADQLAGFRKESTERMDSITEEQRLQREKLDRMVDSEGVDVRVEPVIQAVSYLNDRSARIEKKQDEIFDHIIKLVQRDQKSRPGDQ